MSGGPDRRAPEQIGRRARLELTFTARHGRTVLDQQYAEPPLRIGRCFADTDGGGAHMILASCAPGVFGGDHFAQTIRVGAGARVRLVSQSALQVHPSVPRVAAVVRSRFSVEAGGELQCEWLPTVPFAGAVLDQRFDIDAAEGARVTWTDALMAGREGRGERWQCDAVSHELRLRHGARLVYLERYRVDAHSSCTRRWVADRCVYFGTLIRCGYDDTADIAEALHRALDGCGCYGSADLVEKDLLLVRVAATEGVAFRAAVESARTLLVRTGS